MKLLLDTHIWVWSVADESRLTDTVRRALDDPAHERARSAAVVARSAERGKEIRLIRAAQRRRQQRLLGRRGERLRSGGEPRRHFDAP